MLDNTFNGFALFNDVEDEALRNYNRGRVLCNMYVDNSKDGKTNKKGFALILGYFNKLPVDQRKDAQNEFLKAMKKEGFEIGG